MLQRTVSAEPKGLLNLSAGKTDRPGGVTNATVDFVFIPRRGSFVTTILQIVGPSRDPVWLRGHLLDADTLTVAGACVRANGTLASVTLEPSKAPALSGHTIAHTGIGALGKRMGGGGTGGHINPRVVGRTSALRAVW